MLITVLVFVASIVPTVLIILFLMKRKKEDLMYQKSCRSALIRGFLSVLPVIAVSGGLNILTSVFKTYIFEGINALIYKAIYNFIVLAFSEELVKYLEFRGVLKKKFRDDSWADLVAYMVIIGTAFGLIEDIPYAVGASPMVMIVRGLTMGHVGYGFLMGWFYGKRTFTGEKKYGVVGFLLPWLLHGLYDFSLSEELLAVSDNFAFLGVSLAVLDIVLLILMIRFFVRSQKTDRYQIVIRRVE